MMSIKQSEGAIFSDKSKMSCFVVMPFGAKGEYHRKVSESNHVYESIIISSIESYEEKIGQKIEVIREADRNSGGSITKRILENIATADICIVDITGLNPNVFFELGIRYSLRHKTTILLKQEDTEIPFDISGYKCITYDPFREKQAREYIVDALIGASDEYSSIDSLVFETFPGMQVSIPGILDSARSPASKHNNMVWSEWWARIEEMAGLLRESFDNGRFVPTVVLGISNGGLLIADALGREVFKSVPILSLWANRWQIDKSEVDQSCYYFDNNFNRSTVQQIKAHAGKRKAVILLVDDIVFTANTIIQATAFLKKELDGSHEILFTPMYCRETAHLKSIRDILPIGFQSGKAFPISEEDYIKRLSTTRFAMPYGKVIGEE